MRPPFPKELIRAIGIFSRGTLRKPSKMTNELERELQQISILAKQKNLKTIPLSPEEHQKLLDFLQESAEEKISAY